MTPAAIYPDHASRPSYTGPELVSVDITGRMDLRYRGETVHVPIEEVWKFGLHRAGKFVPRERKPLPAPDDTRLSRRQGAIVRLVLAGKSDLAIARELGIESGTVKNHLQNIRKKAACEVSR